MDHEKIGFSKKLKNIIIGKDINLGDNRIFHKLSLIAFFAWVGLGADGLSSSCYGPAEAYATLGQYKSLVLFVALGTALTIAIISASYSQIIELFPSGGGGYIVASKLLSPTVGMVSGCALLIDYVLTITLSVASGADALFSFLPPDLLDYKLAVALAGLLLLIVLNLRGVKESVVTLMPIFMLFVFTHLFVIVYGLYLHAGNLPQVANQVSADLSLAQSNLGFLGMLFLILKSYSMGAGTYTGIEAVSNGLPILREPKVKTGRKTMVYMAASLAITVMGLMIAYILFKVEEAPGKTVNAVLFEAITRSWTEPWGTVFVWVTLLSEALLLFVAAQTGFLDGPRVLSNMAMDRWFPTKFTMLSDRLVTQNGILLMGGFSLVLMAVSHGSVDMLIVLYSINVFITFALSQLGMVRHWWQERGKAPHWRKRLTINGIGFVLTSFILCSVVVVKFDEGGWMTLLITGVLAALALNIRKHYVHIFELIKKLDVRFDPDNTMLLPMARQPLPDTPDFEGRTAVVLVNGFNGLGLNTVQSIIRYYGTHMKNFIFLQVGVLDAGRFKGQEELIHLKEDLYKQTAAYVRLMRERGFYAEAIWAVGTDVVEEVLNLAPAIEERFPRAVFFGGQIVLKKDSFLSRMLHNYTVFSLQRQMYRIGIPFMILPALLEE